MTINQMEKKAMKTTIAMFCTLALALPGFAQDKAQKKTQKAGIDMDAIFKKLDTNKDGKLSKDEFAKLEAEIREKGEKAAKIADRIKAGANDLFAKLDDNKDGGLSLEEAKKFDITLVGGAKVALKNLDETFKKLDTNNDKKLSKDEFAKVAEQLAAAKPDKAAKVTDKLKALVDGVFTKLDENKDGSLSADEFKKFTGLKDKKQQQSSIEQVSLVAVKAANKAAKKGGDQNAAFKKLDTNNDGKLSKEEFSKVEGGQAPANAKAKKVQKISGLVDTEFTKLDTDKNASLSLDEFKKFTGLKTKKQQ
jgi:Ca2+-binding EF-hand superfamily protein